MSKIVFIKQNSPEIRTRLREAGFSLCPCTEFTDSVWLDYHPDNKELYKIIHGVGCTDDCLRELPPLERIKEWLKWDGWFSTDREFFDTVDDFLEHYKIQAL